MESDTAAPLRRASGAPESQLLTLGNLSLNLANYRVWIEDEAVGLTYQEFELLRLLSEQADQVVPYHVVAKALWQSTSRQVIRRLNVAVHRLRGKIAASSPYTIETVRGRGYGLLQG